MTSWNTKITLFLVIYLQFPFFHQNLNKLLRLFQNRNQSKTMRAPPIKEKVERNFILFLFLWSHKSCGEIDKLRLKCAWQLCARSQHRSFSPRINFKIFLLSPFPSRRLRFDFHGNSWKCAVISRFSAFESFLQDCWEFMCIFQQKL